VKEANYARFNTHTPNRFEKINQSGYAPINAAGAHGVLIKSFEIDLEGVKTQKIHTPVG